VKDLNLPIIKESMIPPRSLSMDEYLEFVIFNLKNIVDITANSEWKETLRVNVPFKIAEKG
jgi:hypothetical protein